MERAYRCLAFLVAILLTSGIAGQDLSPASAYTMHLPYDRGIDFAMAVSGQGDLFSLVARWDGPWKLIRVRHWETAQPSEDQLDIESFSKLEARGLNLDSFHLFFSADGKYLLAIVDGWRLVHGAVEQKSIFTVIDLATFRILSARHETSSLQVDWRQQDNGSILARSFENKEDEKGAGDRLWLLTILGLPDLTPEARCNLVLTSVPELRSMSMKAAGCAPLFSRAGIHSAEDVLRSGDSKAASDQRWVVTKRVGASDVVNVSPDEHFAYDIWSARRDGLIGIVTTAQGLEIFSLHPDKPLLKVRLDKHSSVTAVFASMASHDYLLTVEDGTRLKVYELSQTVNSVAQAMP